MRTTSKAPGLEWIGESFPEVLGQRLASPLLYIVSRDDRNYAFDRAGIPANIHLSRATLYRIAEQMDADYVVLGDLQFRRPDVHRAGATARHESAAPLARAKESGALVKLIDIQTALAWDLLRLVHPELLPSRNQYMAAAPSIRLDAFENYVRGVVATSRPAKIKHLREAIRLSPDYTLAMLQLGRTYFDGRDYEQAATWFARVPRSDPAAREAGFYLGLSGYYMGDFAKSEDAFAFVASRLPLTEVYNNLGVVAGRRGQAQRDRIFSEGGEGRSQRSRLPLQPRRLRSTRQATSPAPRAQLREALTLRPDDAEAKALLDTIASPATAAALRTSDRPAATRQGAAAAHQAQLRRDFVPATGAGDPERRRAAPGARPTRARTPNSTSPAGANTWRRDSRRRRNAIFARRCSSIPPTPTAHVGLARVLEDINEPAARAEAQAALRLQPISTDALLVLARLDLKTNQTQSAEQIVDRVLALEPNNAAAIALKRTIAEKVDEMKNEEVRIQNVRMPVPQATVVTDLYILHSYILHSSLPCSRSLLLSAAPPARADVLRLDVNDTIHPITLEYITRGIEAATAQHAERHPDPPFHSRRPVRFHARDHPADRGFAGAGDHLCGAQRRARGLGRVLHPGSGRRGRHGARHQHRRGASGHDRRRPARTRSWRRKSRTIPPPSCARWSRKRGRNVEVAESAVRQSKSFTDQEALKDKLIDVVAPSQEDLFKQLDGRTITRFNGEKVTLHLANQPVRDFDMTLKQKILAFLMDPNMAFVLLAIGLLSLYIEFNHPGAIVPGVVGFFFVVLAVFALEYPAGALRRAGADPGGVRVLHAGSEVRLARGAHHRRHRVAGDGRAAAGGRAHPADAGAASGRRWRSPFRSA